MLSGESTDQFHCSLNVRSCLVETQCHFVSSCFVVVRDGQGSRSRDDDRQLAPSMKVAEKSTTIDSYRAGPRLLQHASQGRSHHAEERSSEQKAREDEEVFLLCDTMLPHRSAPYTNKGCQSHDPPTASMSLRLVTAKNKSQAERKSAHACQRQDTLIERSTRRYAAYRESGKY